MSRRGNTLIEVLMASTLLGLGLASIAGMTAAAARTMATAWALEDGSAFLQMLVDSLSTTTSGGSGARDEGGGRLTWSVGPGFGAQGSATWEHPALSGPVDVVFNTIPSW